MTTERKSQEHILLEMGDKKLFQERIPLEMVNVSVSIAFHEGFLISPFNENFIICANKRNKKIKLHTMGVA